ncbi:MAG: hypothetical protein U5K30_09525 [Acidimicrobiales bacterium]|nr:hypothetical protein [Acidimicrobiales bacterium]
MVETATERAVRIEPAWDDPDAVLSSVRDVEQYWPIARYAGSEEEVTATGGAQATTYVPPWFRCDFAIDGRPLVPGADRILHNDRFLAGARDLFGNEASVSPTTVYVNVMLPSVVPFVPHLDVPAFRGFTRNDHPVWLLKTMLESGLFERWRVTLATAVSWFYDGPGGAFHYWPNGPRGPVAIVEPPFENVAVLADNERTYHGVATVGGDDVPFVRGLTHDSRLVRVDGGWEMRNDGAVLGTGSDDDVRIAVSWKAEVFPDHEARDRALDHDDDLTLALVVDTFIDDLRSRGLDAATPDDPHRDPDWIRLLGQSYPPTTPSVPIAD